MNKTDILRKKRKQKKKNVHVKTIIGMMIIGNIMKVLKIVQIDA